MKKNFMYVALFAIAFTLGLSSCSKDGAKSTPQGTPTTFTLSLTFPTISRATDDNANAAETVVKNIDVFVINATDGTTATYKRIPVAQWTQSNPNQYTKADIETTIGAKKIFVGVNLSDAMRSSIASDGLAGLNESKTYTISTASLTDVTTGFSMFSTVGVEKTLVIESEVDLGNPSKDNKISVSVERMVAKVGVVKAATITNVTDGSGVVDLTTLMYTLGKTNTKTFAMKHKVDGVVVDPNYTGYPTSYNDGDFEGFEQTTTNYVQVNDNATANNVLTAKYGAENTADIGLKGSNTFAAIKVKFVPALYSNPDGSDRDGVNVNTDDTFWTVSLGDGTRKFFDIEADANTYNNAQTLYAPVTAKYIYGICYYSMYLGKDARYNVIRNTFYKGTINEIKGLGGYKPGIITPTLPTDPISKEAALIDMTVEIAPWNMVGEDWILEP